MATDLIDIQFFGPTTGAGYNKIVLGDTFPKTLDFTDATSSALTIEILTSFAGELNNGYVGGDKHGLPADAIKGQWFLNNGAVRIAGTMPAGKKVASVSVFGSTSQAADGSRESDVQVNSETVQQHDAGGFGAQAPVIFNIDTATLPIDVSLAKLGSFGYLTVINIVLVDDGPTITDIDTNDDVFPGQSAVITGTGFEAVQGTGTVVMGGEAQTVTSWADTSITITVVQGDMDYNNDHDLVVTNDSAEASAALTTTLSADSDHNEIDVLNPVSDNTSLFYLASPAVVTGDQLETPKLTDQGKTLTAAADGTFVITAASGLQTFSIRIWDASDETWSADTIATINGTVVVDMVRSMVSNMTTDMVN